MTDKELIHKVCEKLKVGYFNHALEEIIFSPDPSRVDYFRIHNPNHWLVIIERMRELGFSGGMSWRGESDLPDDKLKAVWFENLDTNKRGECYNEDKIGRAILMAAYKALGGKDE